LKKELASSSDALILQAKLECEGRSVEGAFRPYSSSCENSMMDRPLIIYLHALADVSSSQNTNTTIIVPKGMGSYRL
jgi:hypothetical protein